jgi:hypothetical protein
MRTWKRWFVSVAVLGAGMATAARAQQAQMTFFVTSVGTGKGADLGGLQGADAHCAELARAAGSTKTPWRAYLSTTAGLKETRHMTSWNSAHGTRGCSQEGLKSTGGAGLFYCFVAN